MVRIILIILFILPSFGYADMYSWTDENGVKHFTNTPPEKKSVTVHQTKEYVDHERKNTETQEKKRVDIKRVINALQKENKKNTREKKSKKITRDVVMYVTPTCGYCHRARAFFKKNGVQYTEYDITASAQARKKFESLNGRGVPLILIGDKRIAGFDASAIKKALGLP